MWAQRYQIQTEGQSSMNSIVCAVMESQAFHMNILNSRHVHEFNIERKGTFTRRGEKAINRRSMTLLMDHFYLSTASREDDQHIIIFDMVLHPTVAHCREGVYSPPLSARQPAFTCLQGVTALTLPRLLCSCIMFFYNNKIPIVLYDKCPPADQL